MIHLSPETETLAHRLAAARGGTIEEVVNAAIEESARAAGIDRPSRRMTVEQMLLVGDEIVAMPLRDRRSPREIMDDLNAQ